MLPHCIEVVIIQSNRHQLGQGRPRSWQQPGQLTVGYYHILEICHVAPGLRQCATDVGHVQSQYLEVQHAVPSIWQRATQFLSRVHHKVCQICHGAPRGRQSSSQFITARIGVIARDAPTGVIVRESGQLAQIAPCARKAQVWAFLQGLAGAQLSATA